MGIHGSKMMEKWECLLGPKTLRYKIEEHRVLAYGFRWFNPLFYPVALGFIVK